MSGDAGHRIGEAEALCWEHVEAGATPTDSGRALVVAAAQISIASYQQKQSIPLTPVR